MSFPTVQSTHNLVPRPRLTAPLAAAPTRRLTLVVAPAGYGKTTLLREWAHSRGEITSPLLWYTLSELDNDPAHLLAGLAAAARRPLPAGADAQTSLSYALARLFAPAAGAARSRWLLVLDDLHTITNPAIHQALDILLNLPTWPVHLAIASRTQPSLTAIARLRVAGSLLELDEQALRFTTAEARKLFEASGLAPEEPDLARAVQRTEGWPVALELLRQTARQAARRESSPDLLGILDRLADERPLFDYLAGQVLNDQPADVRQFLRRTALLPYLSAELCNAFLGSADAAARLDALERQHLFIARLDEGQGRRYRYHALFQEFLCCDLEQEEGATAVNVWHRRAAACLLERPTLEEATVAEAAAVDHLLAASDWSAAAEAIETVARRLDLGQFTRMEAWFSRLPADVVAARPHLLLALGQLRAGQGRWNEALAALAQAERLFLADSESDELAQVWYQQAWAHVRQGRYAQTRDICQQALAYLLSAGADHLLRERALVYNLLGGCYSETDDLVRGEQCFQQALQLYRQLGDRLLEAATLSNIAGNIYVIQGRLAETIELGQQAQRILDELGSYRVCYVFTALGMAYRLRGEYEAARAVLERMLQLTDAHQDRMMRGYALYALGHLHREQGRRETACACYDEARLLGEELQEPFVLFEPRLGLALLALTEGDLREAHRHGQSARQQAQTVGNRYQEGLALTALGLVMDQGGNVSQAEAHWRDALRLFEALGANYDQAILHLYLADLYRRAGRDEEALAHLDHSLALSAQYGYDFLYTVRERGRALPLLVAALRETSELSQTPEVYRLLAAIGQEAVEPLLALLDSTPDSVRERVIRLLGEIGDERAIPALRALRGQSRDRRLKESVQTALDRIAAAPRPPLRILALGGFQVWRGDLPIPSEAWPRRKTRLLLLYLLTQRHPVPRDEVLETLWPDLPPDAAGLALNTTFSDLRHILEPYLGQGQPSRYLRRSEETLAFDLTCEAWYDVRAFEQAVQAGGPTVQPALELYRGDFLPEEPYEDWVLRERERLRALYLNTLMARLAEYVRAGAWREGADLAHRVLDRESWLEEVWRALIQCYAMLGRRSEALHAYHACVCALKAELDVGPSPETCALYERLRA
ncbi:MAG: tetratricopeptide repeat protein [Chloroflexi bacterium]|nr:tetratricopeptide repeat protein [Chloroflexota bacterium]MBU1747796.1 tetratricopeptide repeat protein [Chloroflexota bacterium]